MKRLIFAILSTLAGLACSGATVTVGSWNPIFKGIELATGQQVPTLSGEQRQQVVCLRIDLTDPDIKLLTTPKCTNCGTYETISENTSLFLEEYGLKVAINGAFYSSSSGPSDSPVGTPEDIYGLAISKGVVVSPADNASYCSSIMFTTNNKPVFISTNYPATNTAGMYTAITGNRYLLVKGVNVNTATPSDLDPRTAVGLSEDRRYLFLLVVDGRQSSTGWSDGADFYATGEWLKRFGASDGINIDGGGSTTMAQADCQGKGFDINRSSFVLAYGRERNIGQNFGVDAKRLEGNIKNLNVDPGTTTAVLTWQTDFTGTTQVQYGPNTNFANSTPLDQRLLHTHITTLTNLTAGSNYYFRAISGYSGLLATQECQFSTITSVQITQVFSLTNVWRYTTNNLDGVNWKSTNYSDSGWLGSGLGLLYVLENSSAVSPRKTQLPPTSGTSIPRTYYFRTHFNFSGATDGVTLLFSNYVDDGAVFYLNGTEIYRLRMAASPTVITNGSYATGTPCTGVNAGDAATNCPDLFVISGSLLTNLVQGDNVLSVEVHNYSTGTDLVFGSALIKSTPVLKIPTMYYVQEETWGTLYWNGDSFTLQQTTSPAQTNTWTNVPGPIKTGPYPTTNPATIFYRLKN